MIKDLEFVQYITARFCHDLAGALGAIYNGIEFLESNESEVRSKAMDLVKVSSKQANATLKFLRNAYGIAKYEGDADISQIKEICTDMLLGSNISMDFLIPNSSQPDGAIDVNLGKLLLCVIALAKSSLIYGGNIKVSSSKNDGGKFMLEVWANGKDIKIKSDLNDIISGQYNSSDIGATNVNAYYINRLMNSLNVDINIQEERGAIIYIISKRK
ncbi:MAG: hypothetical protein RLZZ59_32 [Pseudomonadota bacterium]|jgi:histidine phosphotransferase ChpT